MFWQKAHPIAGNNTKELPHMCKEQWTGHLHLHKVDGTDKTTNTLTLHLDKISD